MFAGGVLQKPEPVKRRKNYILDETEGQKTGNRQRRTLEISKCPDSKRMTDRKQIRVRQPVGVFADGRSAFRTEIRRSGMRSEAVMTQWDGVVVFHGRGGLIIPWVGSGGANLQSSEEEPQAVKQNHDRKHPDQGIG